MTCIWSIVKQYIKQQEGKPEKDKMSDLFFVSDSLLLSPKYVWNNVCFHHLLISS